MPDVHNVELRTSYYDGDSKYIPGMRFPYRESRVDSFQMVALAITRTVAMDPNIHDDNW